MRVLLIDDHELVWNGTRCLLERVAQDFDWADSLAFSAVRDIDAACQLAEQGFDLILLDYHLPGLQGLEALRQIQSVFEGTVVCMVSAESGGEHIRAVLDAGAAGFIPKSYGEADMASALRLVLRQKVYAPAEFLFSEEIVRGREADEVRSEDLGSFLRSELSGRQREVLGLALQGLPNKSIARRLQIAEGTVKVHLSMVYKALGVKNRVGALCRVLQADAVSALE
ncbi:MAG: response regulator [Roseateles sp.]